MAEECLRCMSNCENSKEILGERTSISLTEMNITKIGNNGK